eukprot:12664986-Alexandrium_andersonii.AAC.1
MPRQPKDDGERDRFYAAKKRGDAALAQLPWHVCSRRVGGGRGFSKQALVLVLIRACRESRMLQARE